MARLLVTGGRHQQLSSHDRSALLAVVSIHNVQQLLHGAASGVDAAVAAFLEKEAGLEIWPFPANWDHGRQAGPKRNAFMATYLGNDDVAVVFPGGDGTKNMYETLCKRMKTMSLHLYDWR